MLPVEELPLVVTVTKIAVTPEPEKYSYDCVG